MVQGVEIVDGHIVDRDPATGLVVARVKVSSPDEVDQLVAAAREAQVDWEHGYSLEQRCALLKDGAKAIGEVRVAPVVPLDELLEV